MITSIAAVSTGAALGALLRWVLAIQFNTASSALPLGTLAANLLGGFLIGLAAYYFAHHAWLPPQWRLLVVTGFLGGLTTFSTFSAEVVASLLERRLASALAIAAAHLLGSIAMTLLGIATMSWWRGSGA